MSTKLNVPLFMFALMIQSILCGMVYMMPADVKAVMPGYVDPTFHDLGMTFNDIPNPTITDTIISLILSIASVTASLALLIGYFLYAPIMAIQLMPTFLQVTIGAFLLAIDGLVIFDIALVIKGLAENISIL